MFLPNLSCSQVRGRTTDQTNQYFIKLQESAFTFFFKCCINNLWYVVIFLGFGLFVVIVISGSRVEVLLYCIYSHIQNEFRTEYFCFQSAFRLFQHEDPLKMSLLILSECKQTNYFLFMKSLENHRFSDDFFGKKLICLNFLDVRSKIWW